MALGTFINSCKTRREHENTLDQNIAIRLVQNNLEDGSPLVSARHYDDVVLVLLKELIFIDFPGQEGAGGRPSVRHLQLPP